MVGRSLTATNTPATTGPRTPWCTRKPTPTCHVRERIIEVAIFALPEAVPGHDYMTAEMFLVGIERSDALTFRRRQELWQHHAAEVVEFTDYRLPIVGGNTGPLTPFGRPLPCQSLKFLFQPIPIRDMHGQQFFELCK
jgi:hypothetical protein